MRKDEIHDLAVPEAHSIIALSEAHAKVVVHNVDILTRSFKQWLQEDVDYTRTLFGRSDKPSLLDPGAQKLRSFFQAYPEIHIIEHPEDRTPGKERVKYVVRADITHVSGVRIGSGVGSCSTDESKYQYRWLTADKLRDLGYTEAQIAALPRREMSARRGGHFTVYRIRNPDILDLDNTILKMASKRAEVDATLSLPGVSGVFTQDIDQYPDALGDELPRKKVDAEAKPVEPQKKEEATKQEPPKPKLAHKDERILKLDPGTIETAEALRKQVEAEAKPVEPQHETAEPEQPKAEKPIVDSAEETVKATLTANGLDTSHLLICKYGDVIRVEPQPGLPDKWCDYDRVLKLLKAKWSDETLRWEVPAKHLEHLTDSPAPEPEEPVYDTWAIDWKLKDGEPAPKDASWAWAFAYTQDGDYIPEIKPLVQYIEQYGKLETKGYTVTLGGRDKNLLNLKKNRREVQSK